MMALLKTHWWRIMLVTLVCLLFGRAAQYGLLLYLGQRPAQFLPVVMFLLGGFLLLCHWLSSPVGPSSTQPSNHNASHPPYAA